MRILAAIAYVVVHLARLWLGQRLFTRGVARISERKYSASFVVWSLAGLLYLLAFVQYFFLTGSFPVVFVGLLAAVIIVLQAATYVLRAHLGIDSPEKVRKINYLSFLWGATAPTAMIFLVLTTIFNLFWPIAVLWEYFVPFGSQLDHEVRISVYHFCIPAVVNQVLLCLLYWHVLTSRNVDDDLRNSSFLALLTISINAEVMVLYPAYLIGSHGTLKIISPGIWVLLFLPILIFVIGVLLPFITGTFRYRAQLSSQVRWMRDWITQTLGNLQTAQNETTKEEIHRLTANLEKRIQDGFNENKRFEYLQNDLTAWREQNAAAARVAQITDQRQHGGAQVAATTADFGHPIDGSASRVLQSIKEAKRALSHSNSLLDIGQAQQQNRLRAFVHEEGEQLVEWDTSFAHLDELLNLRQSLTYDSQSDVINSLKAKQQILRKEHPDLDALRKKNIIYSLTLGIATSGITSIAGWIIKAYEPEIIAFMGKVIRLG